MTEKKNGNLAIVKKSEEKEPKKKRRDWSAMGTDDWIDWLYELGGGRRLLREESVKARLQFQYELMMEIFFDWKYVEDAFYSKYPRKNGTMNAVATSMEPEKVVNLQVEEKVSEESVEEKTDEVLTSGTADEKPAAEKMELMVVEVVESEGQEMEATAVAKETDEQTMEDLVMEEQADVTETVEEAENSADSTEVVVEAVESNEGVENESEKAVEESLTEELFTEGEISKEQLTGEQLTEERLSEEQPTGGQSPEEPRTDERPVKEQAINTGDGREIRKRKRWTAEECLEYLSMLRKRLGRDATQADIHRAARELHGPAYPSLKSRLGEKPGWPKLVDEWEAKQAGIVDEKEEATVVEGNADAQEVERTEVERTEVAENDAEEQKVMSEASPDEKSWTEAAFDESEKAHDMKQKDVLEDFVEANAGSVAEKPESFESEVKPVVNKTETEENDGSETLAVVIHGLSIDLTLCGKRMTVQLSFGPPS